jgi:hydrogenase maturation protease
VHFVFGALPDTDRGAALSTGVVVIGLGNDYRRDDGVGPIIAAAVNDKALPGVRVVTGVADPMSLVEAWSPAALAVLVDAAITSASTPGRIHRCALKDVGGRLC